MPTRLAIGLATSFILVTMSAAFGSSQRWVATWATGVAQPMDGAPVVNNQTVREIVHTSVGGSQVRIRLSNAFGTYSLLIASAHIALRAAGADILPASDRALTFSGSASVTIPPGAVVLSDPADLYVPPLADLVVSLYVPNQTVGSANHWWNPESVYLAAGDMTAAESIPTSSKLESVSWIWLIGVDVLAPQCKGVIVAIGDSLTNGDHSTPDMNRRWTDTLARRLAAGDRGIAVVNVGINGNRVLHDGAGAIGPAFGPSALARFDRDVLSQPGVRYVIVLEGSNDIGQPGTGAPLSEDVSADEIIAGLSQMCERAHEHGLKAFVGTLPPFGAPTHALFFTPANELKRQTVNQWIRSNRLFDGVIDFDKAVRDPSDMSRLHPEFDSGDHTHPNDAGYDEMGKSVDLENFR